MKFVKKEDKQLGPHQITLGMEYDFIDESGVFKGDVKFVRTPPYNTGCWWATTFGCTGFGATRREAVEHALALVESL